jgi:hypothetical protein
MEDNLMPLLNRIKQIFFYLSSIRAEKDDVSILLSPDGGLKTSLLTEEDINSFLLIYREG